MFLSTGFSISRTLLITAVFLFLFVAPAFSHAKTHETIVENTVPEALAAFVAEKTAQNYHQTSALASNDVYYNLDGSIAAYVFSYWLDNKKKPLTISAVKVDEVKQNKALFTSLTPQNSSLEERESALSLLRHAENTLRLRDETVTVIISASFQSEPVLDRFFGIPHHLYKQPLYFGSSVASAALLKRQVFMLSVNELYFFTPSVSAKTNVSKTITPNINSASSIHSVNTGLAADVSALQLRSSGQNMQSAVTDDASAIHSHWEMYKAIFNRKGAAK